MQQRNIKKDFRILFGDMVIVPFLGPALGYYDSAMCSPWWENLVAFYWNDLSVDRELDWKFLKNVKSPPHALNPHPRRLYIDRCIRTVERVKIWQYVDRKKAQWSENIHFRATEGSTRFHRTRERISHLIWHHHNYKSRPKALGSISGNSFSNLP